MNYILSIQQRVVVSDGERRKITIRIQSYAHPLALNMKKK